MTRLFRLRDAKTFSVKGIKIESSHGACAALDAAAIALPAYGGVSQSRWRAAHAQQRRRYILSSKLQRTVTHGSPRTANVVQRQLCPTAFLYVADEWRTPVPRRGCIRVAWRRRHPPLAVVIPRAAKKPNHRGNGARTSKNARPFRGFGSNWRSREDSNFRPTV